MLNKVEQRGIDWAERERERGRWMSSSTNFECRYSNVNISEIDAWMIISDQKLNEEKRDTSMGKVPFYM